jgi:8-oxo-dGTP diphosphatase
MPAPDARRAIVVAAAVIERNGTFLVTRRLEGTHLAGCWEFPGGKCEAAETPEECLRRELREELEVDARIGAEILTTVHPYEDRTIELRFHRCELAGEPHPRLGQSMRWVSREELRKLELPPADAALVALLTGASASSRKG